MNTAKKIDNKTKKPTDEPLSSAYINVLQCTYLAFCRANGIEFKITILKKKPHIPLIPSTENVNIIINSAKEKWLIPFQIMAETAIEEMELYMTPRNQIDIEKGIISVIGTKEHNNGVYTLNPELKERLRIYLSKNTDPIHPFPHPRSLGEAWRRIRNERAKQLNKPELKNIPLKNLRNYAGAMFYYSHGKDAICTMNFMRHKQLQQTLHYLRGVTTFSAKTNTISKAVKLGTPTTITEIMELANNGFTKLTEADGYQIFIKTNVQIG
jgi:integrase